VRLAGYDTHLSAQSFYLQDLTPTLNNIK
jgi:hypothetical protein